MGIQLEIKKQKRDLKLAQERMDRAKIFDPAKQELAAKLDARTKRHKKNFKKYCKGKSVLIVGNSSAMLRKPHRKTIDAYDVVVRLSSATLTPDLHDVLGSKTTLWAWGNINRKSYEYFKDADFFGFVYGRQHGAPNSVLTKGMGKKFFLMETPESRVKRMSETKIPIPSTGLAVINFFIEEIDYSCLSLIGFDFFECEAKHAEDGSKSYYLNDQANRTYRVHNGQVEKAYVKFLESQSKLKILEF